MAQFLTNERYGNGSNGAYAPSTGTDAPIDSACTGTSGTKTLSATNASFAAGQIILIHQTQGTGTGSWEMNVIVSYTAGTITTKYALTNTYNSGAQVIVGSQHTSGNIGGGVTVTVKPYTGTVGGILFKLFNGALTVAGTLTGKGTDGSTSSSAPSNGGGFRGGAGGTNNGDGSQGESSIGAGTTSTAANGMAGGGGQGHTSFGGGGGGGGGHSSSGSNGVKQGSNGEKGIGGGTGGNSSLTTMLFGGTGGGGGAWNNSGTSTGGSGGNSGALVFLLFKSITVTGSINLNGGSGGNGQSGHDAGGGGAGAGGSCLLKGQTIVLGSSLITATAGSAGTGGDASGGDGGAGSSGRIHVDYSTSISGSTSPTLDSTQDRTMADIAFGSMI